MREIKFRAWVKDSYYHAYSDSCGGRDSSSIEMLKLFFKHTAETDDVEQYTGLKDKNGREIYEGDIIRDYDEGYLYKVVFRDGSFMFHDYLNNDYYYDDDLPEHEIIGNIHETPELLEEGKK